MISIKDKEIVVSLGRVRIFFLGLLGDKDVWQPDVIKVATSEGTRDIRFHRGRLLWGGSIGKSVYLPPHITSDYYTNEADQEVDFFLSGEVLGVNPDDYKDNLGWEYPLVDPCKVIDQLGNDLVNDETPVEDIVTSHIVNMSYLPFYRYEGDNPLDGYRLEEIGNLGRDRVTGVDRNIPKVNMNYLGDYKDEDDDETLPGSVIGSSYPKEPNYMPEKTRQKKGIEGWLLDLAAQIQERLG